MARYKMIDRSLRFLPIVLGVQLVASGVKHALDYLIDNELDWRQRIATFNENRA